MMMVGGINFVGEYHLTQEKRERHDQQCVLEKLVSEATVWLHQNLNGHLGKKHPDHMFLVLGYTERAVAEWKKVASHLNGDGTAQEEFDALDEELENLRAELEKMAHICEVIWATEKFLERLEQGCPWTRSKKSHWLLDLEDRETDKKTPEFHRSHLQTLIHRLRHEDLLRETDRLQNEFEEALTVVLPKEVM